MDTPLVSFLLPTRGNPEWLKECVDSLVKHSTGEHSYEILLGIDDDDAETLALFPALQDLLSEAWVLKVIISPRRGYSRLQDYYNDLASISSGQLLALWNDDVVMLSPMWDFYLAQELAEGGLTPYLMWLPQELPLPPHVVFGGFPIIHRKAYEAMGHFSQSPLNDRYLHDVMGKWAGLGDRSYLSRVCIRHDNAHADTRIDKPLLDEHHEATIQNHIIADREALSKNRLL